MITVPSRVKSGRMTSTHATVMAIQASTMNQMTKLMESPLSSGLLNFLMAATILKIPAPIGINPRAKIPLAAYFERVGILSRWIIGIGSRKIAQSVMTSPAVTAMYPASRFPQCPSLLAWSHVWKGGVHISKTPRQLCIAQQTQRMRTVIAIL